MYELDADTAALLVQQGLTDDDVAQLRLTGVVREEQEGGGWTEIRLLADGEAAPERSYEVAPGVVGFVQFPQSMIDEILADPLAAAADMPRDAWEELCRLAGIDPDLVPASAHRWATAEEYSAHVDAEIAPLEGRPTADADPAQVPSTATGTDAGPFVSRTGSDGGVRGIYLVPPLLLLLTFVAIYLLTR